MYLVQCVSPHDRTKTHENVHVFPSHFETMRLQIPDLANFRTGRLDYQHNKKKPTE